MDLKNVLETSSRTAGVQDARKVADAPDVATLVRAARGAVDAVNHAGEQLEKAQLRKGREKARFNRAGRFCLGRRTAAGASRFARKAGGGVRSPVQGQARFCCSCGGASSTPVQPDHPQSAEVAPDAAQRQPAGHARCGDARHGHEN